MNIQILTAARRDLEKGKRFYDRQKEGLGDYFISSLISDIDSLLIYAGIHRKAYGYFCLLSKRFPYAIYYLIRSNEIHIYRVLDWRQNPNKTETYLDD